MRSSSRAPTTYVVDEARGVENPLGHVLPAHRRRHACRGGEALAAAESQAGGGALPPECRGHPVRRLCLGPCHPDRGRKADRRHRDRHGRRHHLHRRLPGRPSGPCRCRAGGRLCRHHRHCPHAGGAPVRGRTHQDPVWRGDGRDGRRRRCGLGGPDGRGGRGFRPARAALHADPHHPGPAGGDFRRGPDPASGLAASTWRPAAARC